MRAAEQALLQEMQQNGLDSLEKMLSFMEQYPESKEIPKVYKAYQVLKKQERLSKRPNKGIEKKQKKRAKNSSQMRKTKPEQENICRFVNFEYMTFQKINGKERATGKQKGSGLQIGNKIYLSDGHYKLVNNRNLKITKRLQGVPESTTDLLKQKYEEYQDNVQ